MIRRIKSSRLFCCELVGILLVALALVIAQPHVSAQEDATWKEDWAIERGFSITTDVSGVQFPSSLTFVPNPGSAPKDPLYFVTELPGTIKVVTNDRTVYTFAENFVPQPPEDEAFNLGTQGLTGVCLDPEHGYVFAIFADHTSVGPFANHLVRFQSMAGTFSVSAADMQVIAPVIESFVPTAGHQIDSCVVLDGLLYVTIGDGGKLAGTQDIHQPFGKILRMTLDGAPAPNNPYYTDGDASNISNYVWASGLRNPYAIKVIDGRIYVFDNGNNTDRLLAIQPGENYLWDGTDWSISANAMMVVSPSFGPAQMDYIAADSTLFPASHAQTLYVASTATDAFKVPGIISLPVDFSSDHVAGVPRFFMQFRGEGDQYIVGLAQGPDALYFTAILPDSAGETHVFKINYNPQNAHPYIVGEDSSGLGLMNLKACLNCHSLNGIGGSQAPVLDQDVLISSVQTRLNSDAYRTLVSQLDQSSDEPFLSYRSARQEVLAASGIDQTRLWLQYHLLEPKFDNPAAQMPNLSLTPVEASRIADYLLASDPTPSTLSQLIKQFFPILQFRHLVIFFALGLAIGAGLAPLGRFVRQKRRASRTAGEDV